MPFTLSHVGLNAPVFRFHRLDRLALSIGSMAPDIGYYLLAFDLAAFTHEPSGAFQVALPATVASTILLRHTGAFWVAPLPVSLQQPLLRGLQSSARSWWVTIASSALGVASHLFFDAWTHRSGHFVITGWVPTDGFFSYRFLQHFGSLLGLLLLFHLVLPKNRHGASLSWHRMGVALRCRGLYQMLAVLFLAALLALPFAHHAASFYQPSLYRRALIFRETVMTINFCLLFYFGTAFWSWKHR